MKTMLFSEDGAKNSNSCLLVPCSSVKSEHVLIAHIRSWASVKKKYCAASQHQSCQRNKVTQLIIKRIKVLAPLLWQAEHFPGHTAGGRSISSSRRRGRRRQVTSFMHGPDLSFLCVWGITLWRRPHLCDAFSSLADKVFFECVD